MELLVGRSGGAHCEFVDAVARETGVGVAVDETRDRCETTGVELLDLAVERAEVAHPPGRRDSPVLAEDVPVLEDVNLTEGTAAERSVAAGRSDEPGEIADKEAAHRVASSDGSRPSGAGPVSTSGNRAYASPGTSVSSSTPAPCFCASSETG
jgi:hypothetical protein